MTKIGDAERETLRISADAAGRLLVSLREQRAKVDDRIAKLQAVVEAWDSISGKRRTAETGAQDDGARIVRHRVKKGQVAAHIDQILQAGGEYDEPELRKLIEDRFSVKYERATVYTSLRRGLKDHKYQHQGKKWSLNPMRVSKAA